MAVRGSGFTRPVSRAGTSNTQPWLCDTSAVSGRSSVSSQVSQEPQGVWPPQQLVLVPTRLRCWRSTTPVSMS